MGNLVELKDVQGIIIKGYGNMPYASYLMLHFKNSESAKKWLSDLIEHITNASTSTKSIENAFNIAFSYRGITKLGLNPGAKNSFPREFIEGMVTEHRQRILGDFGESDPINWSWGGKEDQSEIHATLMIYAKTEEILREILLTQKQKMKDADILLTNELSTSRLFDKKEHFGFRDGITNPVMKDAGRRENDEAPANLINPGEFIFGYKNEYDKYPTGPRVPSNSDQSSLLKSVDGSEEEKDLGRNGSMLVFRQMEQKVIKFWKFIEKSATDQREDGSDTTIEHLASKMVGRWPDGTPLTLCPFKPEEKHKASDKFGYAKDDFDGFKCPIGSHIRRTNSRDDFLRNSSPNKEKNIEKSEKFMKRFRILRRGRAYGEPVSPTLNPHEVIESQLEDSGRGLHFLCFNTNIVRQFELIQQTWINNPKFAGLYNDPDPIIGYPEIMGEGATSTFTEQATPIRKKVSGIPRFVEIKGGAYFFMPGLNALRYLSSI